MAMFSPATPHNRLKKAYRKATPTYPGIPLNQSNKADATNRGNKWAANVITDNKGRTNRNAFSPLCITVFLQKQFGPTIPIHEQSIREYPSLNQNAPDKMPIRAKEYGRDIPKPSEKCSTNQTDEDR